MSASDMHPDAQIPAGPPHPWTRVSDADPLPGGTPEELAARQREFREAAGHFATGVCVVTAFSANGPTGMTANAFTSLSLDPLLLVVCFDKTARTLGAARESGRVGVSVLSSAQRELSPRFASKSPEDEKFEGVAWSEHGGVPVLDGCVAWFAGSVDQLVPGGDHEIGVVAVEEFGAPGGEPLVFHRGGYVQLGR